MNAVIVDDNKTNLVIFEAILGQIENINAICFENPLDAFAYCEDLENSIDLLVVDFMMPFIDGVEFVGRFRKLHGKAEIPIIVVTAFVEPEIRYKALEAGANDFLTKPIDKVELKSRVKNMLTLRSHQIESANRAEWLKKEIEKATYTILEREREIVFRLCKASEYRDPETGMHVMRMAAYSEHIAKKMGFSKEASDLLLEAAPMHDIGKVGIPDDILLKPAKLTEPEFEIMQTHSTIGYKILSDSNSQLMKAAAEIALCHHEKFDGSGYPNGLKGEEIPIFARIVAVADVFDALTSDRPYKKAWDSKDAIELIKKNSGSHFDPECVEAFLKDWHEVLYIKAKYKDEEEG